MSLTRQDVEKVSLLARLQFDDQELNTLTEELSAVVGYFELLSELDTEGVEPLVHAVENHNVFAADEVAPSLDRDQALANAPKRDQEC